MNRIVKVIQAVLLVMSLYPLGLAAGFGMGGGPSVGVGMAMGTSTTMGDGGNASSAHGSPAATNPAVAAMEARQRDAEVGAEIEQARKAGRNVVSAEADRRKAEGAVEINHGDEAMVHLDQAERDMGIVSKTTAMGTYTKSSLGSVTSGGTELSGAVVH